MKRLIIVAGIVFSLVIVYALMTKNTLVDYSTKRLDFSNAPEYIQEWANELSSNEDAYLCRGSLNNKMIIYLYLPENIVEYEKYKGYKTIHISPIKKEGINIQVVYKDLDIPKSTLIEISINKPKINYIKLNNKKYLLEDIPEIAPM
jgi:hypothetical protein